MRFSFSVNLYDNEGDLFDVCVLAHFDSNTILRFENLKEMELLIENMQTAVIEIKENYPKA
jgi:hypothetical protein